MTIFRSQFLLTGFILLVLANSCNENKSADSLQHNIPVDSLGIGKTIQFFELPGRIIALNPDSANKIIVLGEKGKRMNTIYKGTGSPDQPMSLNHLAVDDATMEIYIYSPSQHTIFVYDADGNYKNKISIPEADYGSFVRLKGRFIFFARKDSLKEDSNTKMYFIDSTGHYVDGW